MTESMGTRAMGRKGSTADTLGNQTRSAFQRKLTILSTTIIIQAVHNYKSGNTIPENISLSAPV